MITRESCLAAKQAAMGHLKNAMAEAGIQIVTYSVHGADTALRTLLNDLMRDAVKADALPAHRNFFTEDTILRDELTKLRHTLDVGASFDGAHYVDLLDRLESIVEQYPGGIDSRELYASEYGPLLAAIVNLAQACATAEAALYLMTFYDMATREPPPYDDQPRGYTRDCSDWYDAYDDLEGEDPQSHVYAWSYRYLKYLGEWVVLLQAENLFGSLYLGYPIVGRNSFGAKMPEHIKNTMLELTNMATPCSVGEYIKTYIDTGHVSNYSPYKDIGTLVGIDL